MAKEECIEQWNKTGGISTLRNRKIFPTSEKTPSAPLSKDTNIHATGRLSKDDTQPSNGTPAQFSSRVDVSNELLLMLVVGMSFSTRLYKIAEPPHVWWVKPLCMLLDCVHLKAVHFVIGSGRTIVNIKCEHALSVPLFLFYIYFFLHDDSFQLGWDALWKDGKLLHQQDLLFWCPSSSWKSEKANYLFLCGLHFPHGNLTGMSIDLLPLICCRCW